MIIVCCVIWKEKVSFSQRNNNNNRKTIRQFINKYVHGMYQAFDSYSKDLMALYWWPTIYPFKVKLVNMPKSLRLITQNVNIMLPEKSYLKNFSISIDFNSSMTEVCLRNG